MKPSDGTEHYRSWPTVRRMIERMGVALSPDDEHRPLCCPMRRTRRTEIEAGWVS